LIVIWKLSQKNEIVLKLLTFWKIVLCGFTW
jgi:hypothetical protein